MISVVICCCNEIKIAGGNNFNTFAMVDVGIFFPSRSRSFWISGVRKIDVVGVVFGRHVVVLVC